MYALRKRKLCGLNSVRTKITLHTFLNDDLNFEKIKKHLERNSSSINKVNVYGETPLIVVLKNENCSAEIVKLLLEHGADIDCKDPSSGESPFILALNLSKDKEIIKILVDESPDLETDGMSPLCIAMSNSMNDVVRLLLEEGFAYDNCQCHNSMLHCAACSPKSGLTEDIFNALLKMQTDVNCIDENDQTALCLALQHGAELRGMDLLLHAGASLYACKRHEFSPLLCVTDDSYYTEWNYSQMPLKTKVIKWLLDAGVPMDTTNANGWTPLQLALANLDYDTEAIKMLLNLPGLDINMMSELNETLLHLAASNSFCKPEILKILIDQKVPIESKTINGETALFPAIRADNLNNVKLLLKRGCPVNASDNFGKTPLLLSIKYLGNYSLLKVLLMAGAQIVNEDEEDLFLYVLLLKMCEELEFDDNIGDDESKGFKLLLKFKFLQNPLFEFELIKFVYPIDYEDNVCLANSCVRELRKMEVMQVGNGLTLFEFVSQPTLPQLVATDYNPEDQTYDIDKLLQLRPHKEFPTYFEVIASRVGRWAMEAKLEKLLIYTIKKSSNSHCTKKVILSYECALAIAQYLSEEDFMKFILAFYKTDSTISIK